MKSVKKAFTYLVGASVIAGVSAYMAMPRDARENLKNMIGSLSKKKSCASDDSTSK